MGTWDSDSFGNDTAADWTYGLNEVDDLRLIETTLDAVLAFGRATPVSAECAECAVAAAEVLARLKGHWGEESAYSETADAWVRSHPTEPPAELIAKAVAVLRRITTAPSDLLELWDEQEEAGRWVDEVRELEGRVTAT